MSYDCLVKFVTARKVNYVARSADVITFPISVFELRAVLRSLCLPACPACQGYLLVVYRLTTVRIAMTSQSCMRIPSGRYLEPELVRGHPVRSASSWKTLRRRFKDTSRPAPRAMRQQGLFKRLLTLFTIFIHCWRGEQNWHRGISIIK